MRILIIIGLLISLTTNSQIKSKQHINDQEALAAVAVLVSTATTVHFMDTPPEYYGNDHLMRLRYRQRAIVAFTGMVTTTITYYVVKNIRHKVRRNKSYKKVCKWQ